MLAINKADREDIPVIQDLTQVIWPAAYGQIISPEQLAYMLELMYSTNSLEQQITGAHHQFLLLKENDDPLGFASYSQNGPPGHFRLHKLYVLPNQQGKGLGKFLLEYVIKEIKSLGAVQLELNVNRHNKAKFFYEKLGFRIIREEDTDIGNGYFMNDYIMTISL